MALVKSVVIVHDKARTEEKARGGRCAARGLRPPSCHV